MTDSEVKPAGGEAGRAARMRLRLAHKLALILVCTSMLVGVASFVALNNTLNPTFIALEQDSVRDQTARAESALQNLNKSILSATLDYAVWDDTFDYASAPNIAYEREMFTLTGLDNVDVDVMGVVRYDGTPIAMHVTAPGREEFDTSETALIGGFVGSNVFVREITKKETFGTYFRGQSGLYSIQASKIHRNEGDGDAPAFFIMGRRLDSQMLSEALQTSASLSSTPQSDRVARFEKGSDTSLIEEGDQAFETIIALRNPVGEVLGTLKFKTDKAISRSGTAAIKSAILAMAMSFAALAIVIALGVNRTVVNRLSALQGYITSLGNNRSSTPDWLSSSHDEIGQLARQFDVLNDELEEAEQELRQQSYVQGKADSAVGMLHNVRNAIGPLQVKYDKWLADDSSALNGQILMALDEMDRDETPVERRAALEKFIRLALQRILTKSEERVEELRQVKGSIDQITGILAEYDFDSSAKLRDEPVNVGSMIRKEVANQQMLEKRPIELLLPESMPRVQANHLHLAQLIGNILRNAVEAMREQAVPTMQLDVDCREAKGDMVEILFTDNGAGLDREALAKAFERGFSTKANRTGGMGLHWSANAARAMKGELRLESPGPGKGATVVLVLPKAVSLIQDQHSAVAA